MPRSEYWKSRSIDRPGRIYDIIKCRRKSSRLFLRHFVVSAGSMTSLSSGAGSSEMRFRRDGLYDGTMAGTSVENGAVPKIFKSGARSVPEVLSCAGRLAETGRVTVGVLRGMRGQGRPFPPCGRAGESCQECGVGCKSLRPQRKNAEGNLCTQSMEWPTLPIRTHFPGEKGSTGAIFRAADLPPYRRSRPAGGAAFWWP